MSTTQPPSAASSLRTGIATLALALLALGCDGKLGHPTFASPHASPIARSPTGSELYVVNTPADTLDVIDVVPPGDEPHVERRHPTHGLGGPQPSEDGVGVGLQLGQREVVAQAHRRLSGT